MAEKKETKTEKKETKTANIVSTRGRFFEGFVVKKFSNRVVIEYERTIYAHKYERFYKKKSRIHARLPGNLDINLGDYVRVQQCRPLSKIIHHMVIAKIRSAEEKK